VAETKAERKVRVAEAKLVKSTLEWAPMFGWIPLAGNDADLFLLILKRHALDVHQARAALAAERRAARKRGSRG
jgi:hypothetical protein